MVAPGRWCTNKNNIALWYLFDNEPCCSKSIRSIHRLGQNPADNVLVNDKFCENSSSRGIANGPGEDVDPGWRNRENSGEVVVAVSYVGDGDVKDDCVMRTRMYLSLAHIGVKGNDIGRC